MPARALFVMMLCNVVWALNVVVGKVAIVDLGSPPLFYALLRSVIVAAVLVPLLRPLPAEVAGTGGRAGDQRRVLRVAVHGARDPRALRQRVSSA